MLRDLSRRDWLALLPIPESRIPRTLILRGTRNLRRQFEAMLPFFSNVTEVGSPNGIFEDILLGDVDGVPVGYASVYGAAMASEITHLFGVLGASTVIQIGNCGALADGMQAGDLFVADRAYCGEGAAQYYRPGPWVDSSVELTRHALLCSRSELCRGAIYTTGALLAESAADLDRWHQQGFAAVDMETATTFAVAEHFRMRRLSLLYAFDNPRQREHLMLTDAEKDRRREHANASMLRLALALAVEAAA